MTFDEEQTLKWYAQLQKQLAPYEKYEGVRRNGKYEAEDYSFLQFEQNKWKSRTCKQCSNSLEIGYYSYCINCSKGFSKYGEHSIYE